MLSYVNDQMAEFIKEQEIMFIATADSKGNCDISLRTGMPGFVVVVDEKTIAYPEFRGNGVLASLGNIHENPHVGLMLIDFFQHCIGLHVNGTAEIVENAAFLAAVADTGCIRSLDEKTRTLAERWVVVSVEEAYIHCSKHIPLLKKLDKTMHWGTDNQMFKGGDFFGVKGSNRTASV
ncbi:pyridoxamine 5'-phosphate oxidase family protein (plasmid) [Paenibacillus cellulosilyticus]|nr:pyridoxamine 5'-phosphate oxidase family protein [Paenibacillus cellulosilyticus]